MGLGGIINEVFDPFNATGARDKVPAPDPSKAGADYSSLLNAYLKSAPDIYANEATYQPLYTDLGIQNTARTVSGVKGMSGDIMSTMRGYNPSATGLLDTLSSQAQQQLSLNGALDPATQRQVQQGARSSQAARGLGYGPGDAAMEDFYQTQTMENRRAANQQFAGNVAAQSAGTYGDPFSKFMGLTGKVSSTPGIISSAQSDSMLGTTYNAQAAANIATANKQSALDNSY